MGREVTSLRSSIRTIRYAVSDGLTLAADVAGDSTATPVILLHGGGQTRHSWSRAMLELSSQGYHVINVDSRGHGDSDWPATADYSPATLARDLRCIIDTLPLAPAIIGASMGGATALHAVGTANLPIARAIVLVDVTPRIEMEGSEKILEFMRARSDGFSSLEEAHQAVAHYNPHRRAPTAAGLMKNLRWRKERLYWHWDPKFIEYADAVDPTHYAETLHQAAKAVSIPTLLVRGLQSDVVSIAGIEEFRKHLPHLEVADVAGAGHMVVGDKNDAFNQAAISFLKRHLA